MSNCQKNVPGFQLLAVPVLTECMFTTAGPDLGTQVHGASCQGLLSFVKQGSGIQSDP